MIDIAKYFLILFMVATISYEHLKQFTETHINRLAANNPGGIYSGILATVTTAYALFFGNSASEALFLSVQKGLTLGMNNSKMAMLSFIRQKEGAIKSRYGKGSLEYLQAFPNGLEGFDRASLIDLKTMGINFLAFLVAHAADLETGLVATMTTLLGTFETNRELQLTQIGTVHGAHTNSFDAKVSLCKILTYNLLTVARDNIGFPERVGNYFDTSIIVDGKDLALRGKAQVGGIANVIGEGLTLTSTFSWRNNGNVSYFISRSLTPYTDGPLGQTCAAGAEGSGGTAELGVGPYLNISAISLTEEAVYSVTQTA